MEGTIRIKSVSIDEGRLSLDVTIDPAHLHMDPSIVKVVEEDYPLILGHACRNAFGPTFADVIEHTSVAHLLEHLLIENQISSTDDGEDHVFVGNTEWIDSAKGSAHIEVNFFDDLVALRALKESVSYLNSII